MGTLMIVLLAGLVGGTAALRRTASRVLCGGVAGLLLVAALGFALSSPDVPADQPAQPPSAQTATRGIPR